MSQNKTEQGYKNIKHENEESKTKQKYESNKRRKGT